MTFPLTPAAPFTASVSTISATTANAWRTYISRSLDTVDGGAYANTTAISWSAGSAGWTFSGPLTVGATSTFVMTSGATVTLAADATVSSGGGWDFEGGSLCRFRGTAGGATLQVDDNAIVTCAGDVTWSATSTQTYAASSAQTHASGSSDVYSSGATLTVASGAVATLNLGGVSAAGITFIGANGSAVWNGASTATWQTASTATWDNGSTMACNGTTTWGAASTQTHASGSVDTYSAGSIINLLGALLLGAGGEIGLRYVAGTDADATLNSTSVTIVTVPQTFAADRFWTLAAPTSGAKPFIVLYRRSIGAGVGTLHVKDAGSGVDIATMISTTDKISMLFCQYTGTAWFVLFAWEMDPTMNSPLNTYTIV